MPNGTTLNGTIRVRKITQPATDNLSFNFVLTGKNVNRSLNVRHNQTRAFADLTPATGYQLVETVLPGWKQTAASCNDGSPLDAITLSNGETIICTFTNVQTGTLVINKITEPSSDNTTLFTFTTAGGLTPASFSMTGGSSETLRDITPGSGYRVLEVLPAGWIQRSAVCSNGGTLDNITITSGGTTTCTITNTKLGKLIVRKSTTPNPDRTNAQFSFTTGGALTPSSFTLKNGESREFVNLQPGNGYSVREQPLANWQTNGATCDNNSPLDNIQIDPGQTVTCTFHNEATLVDLQLDKSDDDFIAEPGDTIVYRLKYRNIGNKNAEAVMITEQVPAYTTFAGPTDQWSCAAGAPAGTTCSTTIGMLVGGSDEGEVLFSVTVNNPLPADATQVENVARLSHSGNATAAESSELTPLEANIGLKLSKDDGGVSAGAGALIAYTLAYRNEGTQAALGVVISETVPAHTTFAGPSDQWSCTIGNLAGTTCRHDVGLLLGQAAGTVPFHVKVIESLPAELSAITNRATIGALLNPNADEGTDRTEIVASPDLTLGLSDNNITVAPGGSVRYRLSYANVSARAAAGVLLTATLPPNAHFNSGASSNGWQCNTTACTYPIGVLPSGGGSAVDFGLTLDRPLPAGITAIILGARIDDNGQSGTDLHPQNNAATEETPVEAPLAFSATKRDSLAIDRNSDGQAGPGDTIEYTIVVRNDGGLGLRQLVLTDEIDANVQLVTGATTSQGTISQGNNSTDRQVVVNIGDLAGAGGSATIRFRVMVNQPLAAGVYAVQNQATVRSPDFADRRTDDPDTTQANDATQTQLNATIQLRANLNDFLFIDADSNIAVTVGDTLIYQLAVQNIGNVNTGPLSLAIPLDPNVTLVAGTIHSTQGRVIDGSDDTANVLVDVDNITPGATVLVNFQVKISTGNTDAIRHQAAIAFQSVNGQQSISSDDPDTVEPGDSTVTRLGGTPQLRPYFLPLISR